MIVWVTGGAGFIGSAFLLRALERYPDRRFVNVDKLTYAANLASLESVSESPRYRLAQVDVTDFGALDRLASEEPPDLVVHLAAESHVDRSILGPREFVRTNIEGTFNLLEVVRKCWAGRTDVLFHHVSTDEVYGSLGATGRFVETSRYEPSSPYSATKAASDHLVRAWGHTYGLPIKITNCSNNYGPRQVPEKLIPLIIRNLLARKPLPIYGKGENVRDWLYVDDHVEAIWAVIERGRVGETYNIGGDQEQRNIDVVNTLCRIVSKLTGASEDELLALRTFVTDRPGHDLRYAIDASRVKGECGWSPRETFATGLEKTVRWYLDHPTWVSDVEAGGTRTWLDASRGLRT